MKQILANHEIWENFVTRQDYLNCDFATIDELLADEMSLQIMESYKVSQNSLREIITRLRRKRQQRAA